MRTYITTLLLATTLILASCGGGNDVASSGATAVSAATSATTPDVTPNTTATTPTVTTPTKPKINGQIDERTGVAPVVAQITLGGKGGTGMCLSESCCPTPSEFGACLLKYYPLCQYTNICEGSSSAALNCSVQFVTNPACAYVNADRGWDTLVDGDSLYGCAGPEGICSFSVGAGSSMTTKNSAGSSLMIKKQR